jgi:hypothetical protein
LDPAGKRRRKVGRTGSGDVERLFGVVIGGELVLEAVGERALRMIMVVRTELMSEAEFLYSRF